MYLRSLELLGFKSFARKTELRFPRGVAAVVGPNGCGKSNVLDAIRWVLGEQSAKALRGSEMSDVIFNGTEALPALGLAQVSLTFSDCEAQLGTAWNEVRLTRRVYRDGGSEYLLNNTACRLRDIHELFMDTGVGRSAYSIMEQGRIDQILSSRPEDRRAVFEEAAGITKYKAQRRDALRKLEATSANLQRLGDVLAEVRRQLGSLSRQAGKARRFQALHHDLALLETHLGHAQYLRLDHELRHARAEIERLHLLAADHAHALAADEAALATHRHTLADQEARLELARAQVAEDKNRLLSARSRLEFNAERLADSRARRARLETELTAARENLRDHQDHLRAADAAERAALAQLADDQASQTAEDTRVRDFRQRRLGVEAALTAATRRASEADGRLGNARSELARAAADEAAAEARKEALERELAPLSPAWNEATARVAALRKEIADAERVLTELRAALTPAESAATAAQQALAQAEAEVVAAGRRLAEKTSRLNALRALTVEGEGLASGAKAALRGAGRSDLEKENILGALGPLLEVEPRFIPAVEAALGAHLQAILVTDADVAAKILASLHEKKLGRAALAPVEEISGLTAAKEPPLPKGAVASLLTAVRALPPANALLTRWLADTWIAEDFAAARRLRRELPGCAVATLAGEFLSQDGVWHGGRTGGETPGQALLKRRAEISTLERESAETRTALNAAEVRRDAAGVAARTAADALREARQAAQDAAAEAGNRRAQLGPAEREERTLAQRLETSRRELADVDRRSATIRERSTRLHATLAEHDAALSAALAERAAAQESLDALRREEETLTAALSELRIRVAAEQQRHAGLVREKLPLAARCKELATWIENAGRDLEEQHRRIAAAEAESVAAEETIASATAELNRAEAAVAALAAERAELAATAESLEATLRERRGAVSGLQARRGAEEVREAELRLRQENLAERLEGKYHLDLRLFVPQPATYEAVLAARARENRSPRHEAEITPAETDGAALKLDADFDENSPESAPTAAVPLAPNAEAIVAQLQARLDSIGAVNLDAIAEHDALEERHRFLESQDADLRKAEAELRGIIAKLNATSRELFNETFEKVRVHFGEMFRELFGGGQADLALLADDDPLESGIEITARPPGKPRQSLSLLSGGEKTMTAVALLFAIYLVKPSPFCVLDEMDAPLDESNIGRFIKVLDRFAEQSQFLVITHNKRTIARADALFGVTMEEAGISKLVTVRLARADEEGENGKATPDTSDGEAIAQQQMNGSGAANGGDTETPPVAAALDKADATGEG